MNKRFPVFLSLISAMVYMLVAAAGCANIIPPGGGPIDSIPPMLVSATPKDSARNVAGNRLTLYFNEFVEIQNAQENVIVSPLPNNSPQIDGRLRTVNIRLRDTLEPNTTYSINFGNAIRDINEGNVLRDFIYVFSTGNTIDSNTLSGKVVLAETGKVDSTMIVMLHRNLDDSAVAKERPRYLAKLDGQGNFIFNNLPAGRFGLFALSNDYSRKYEDSTQLFAFADSVITVGTTTAPQTLYAYNYPKAPTRTSTSTGAKAASNVSQQEKALRLTTSLEAGGKHDILRRDVELIVNRPVNYFDSNSLVLTNKDFAALPGYYFRADTNKTRFYLSYPWEAGQEYQLLVKKEAFQDSAGITLARNDTITISTKRTEEYGSVKIRFTNLNLQRNPVLQLIQGDKIVDSIPLTSREWTRKLFPPGEFDLRILYDTNKNGRWDPGSYFNQRRQPEIVQDLGIKLSVRGNWDNEKDITL